MILYVVICVFVFVRSDQGGAQFGRRDPEVGDRAVPAEERADHGQRVPLCYLPGRSAGEQMKPPSPIACLINPWI